MSDRPDSDHKSARNVRAVQPLEKFVRIKMLNRSWRAAAVGLVVGLALTACSSNSSGASAAGSGSAGASATASGSTTGATDGSGSGSTGSTGSGGGSTSGSTTAAGSGTVTATGNCTAATLKASIAAGSGAQSVGSTGAEVVQLTNVGSRACTMHGFPGVDLVAADGTHWSLQRTQATARTVSVAPGGSAYFAITYMPYQSGGGREFNAKTIVITPPDDTRRLTIGWGAQSLEDQSGATRPATFVEPVVGTNPALS